MEKILGVIEIITELEGYEGSFVRSISTKMIHDTSSLTISRKCAPRHRPSGRCFTLADEGDEASTSTRGSEVARAGRRAQTLSAKSRGPSNVAFI